MKDYNVPDYDAFFNNEAMKMAMWSLDEEKNNLRKAYKLYKTACRMEKRFRKYHGIIEGVPWRTGNCITLPSPFWFYREKRKSKLV